MKFQDKSILITGASSGIGKAVALRVAQDKGTLILAARGEDKLNQVKQEVEKLGAKAYVIPTDVTDAEQVKSLFLKSQELVGNIDAVFNNAGLGHIAKINELTVEQIEQLINVNIKGMILVTKFASEVMTRQQNGHIIMTSSLAGLITLPQWSVYVASKWAITGFADSIRPEMAEYDVKVSTLHPGAVTTEFFDKNKANVDIKDVGEAITPDHQIAHVPRLPAVAGQVLPRHVTRQNHRLRVVGADGGVEHPAARSRPQSLPAPVSG